MGREIVRQYLRFCTRKLLSAISPRTGQLPLYPDQENSVLCSSSIERCNAATISAGPRAECITTAREFFRIEKGIVVYDCSMTPWYRQPAHCIATNRDFSLTGAAPKPMVLFLFALFILWGFGVETVGKRLRTQLDGTIVSSRDIPPSRGSRYVTEYILRGSDGRETTYVAGPTDASLPRSMPVGTHLKKQRWALSYERNGERLDDFNSLFYVATQCIAIVLAGWGIRTWLNQRRRG